jgi:hypothetical protein
MVPSSSQRLAVASQETLVLEELGLEARMPQVQEVLPRPMQDGQDAGHFCRMRVTRCC